MKKIITLLLVLTFSSFATSYNTITINGTNAEWAADEDFTDISSADNAYFTWDADYLYFGIADAEADYGNMTTFMYFDTDPEGSNGTTDAYAWGNNIIAPFKADYVIVWRNNVDFIGVQKWNGSSWEQVSFVDGDPLNDGDYVVDMAVTDGNDYREISIKRTTIGSPSKIKVASFTEQQWGSNWRYFAWPSADWIDQNRGANQPIHHYKGFDLSDAQAPDALKWHDGLLTQNEKVLDLRSDENHYIEISDNANNDLDLGSDFTVEAWIYIENVTTGTRGNERILRSQNWQWFIVSGTGEDGANATLRMTLPTGGTIDMSVSTEQWHHICWQTNSAGWSKNYLNGVALQEGGNQTISGQSNLRIGSYSTVGTGFEGAIDEVRLSTGNRYAKFAFTVNENDLPFENDANTILLFHFDNVNQFPPRNSSLKVFTITNNGVDAGDYTDFDDPSFAETLPLPVELTSFTALPQGEFVNLTWETATEANNYGFEIERSVVSDQRSANWENVGFVEGHGNSNSVKQYAFTDNTVIAGQAYSYRLKQIDFDGQFEYSSIVNVEAGIPTEFNLEQNYPNPFNPATLISFSLPKAAQVNLSVYNVLGEKVAQLINTQMEAGKHNINFNASNLSTGTYIYRIETPEFSTSKKMMLVK